MGKRILVAAVGIPVLLFLMCWCPAWGTLLLVDALCIIGAHELLSAAMEEALVGRFWGLAAGIGVLTVCVGSEFGDAAMQSVFCWCLAALVLALFIVLILEHGRESGLRFRDLLVILASGVLIPLALGSLVRLRLMPYGGGLVMIPLVAAFCSDSAALFTGMSVPKDKKRPLIPTVSPKKTRQGAVGGLVGGMVGMVLFRIVFFLVTEVQLNILWCLLMGLMGAVLGQIGDLVFSCIKRECGLKDYGKLLPGHGGVLDRFDSVIFAAPVLWLLISGITLY